jgi:hypothetical protein
MRKDGARVAFEFEAAGYARLCARQVLGREHGQAQILYARRPAGVAKSDVVASTRTGTVRRATESIQPAFLSGVELFCQ